MNTALNRTVVVILANKSGGTLNYGDVVILGSATAKAFTTTTTSGDVSASIGVIVEKAGIANNASGMVALSGWVPQINLSSSASLYDYIKTHSVAGQGVPHATPAAAGDFAMALETGTTPSAFLFGKTDQGGGGALLTANNLSDLASAVTARANIGVEAAKADVASGSTTNIGAATTQTVRITGTTTITAFDTVADGIFRRCYFAGVLTLTHNATSLILPGGANITTAAGDSLEALSLGSGNWKVLWYTKADGTAVVAVSGGAPSTAPYVTTAANGSLSAEIVLPFLGNYSADKAPASPSGSDDEFDDNSIAGAWSQIGTPDTISESTYHGFLYVEDNDSTACGVRAAYAPGAAALTVVIKLSAMIGTPFGNILLALEDSGPATLASVGIQNNNSGSLRTRELNGASETNTTIIDSFLTADFYLMVQRDSTTNYVLKISRDGKTWRTLKTFSKAGTIANVSVLMDSQGAGSVNSSMAIDFIRFFTSQTDVIGAAP